MPLLRILPPLVLLLPTIAFAAPPRTFQALANLVVALINNATVVLIALAVVVYFYGISTNILKFGDEGQEKVRAYFFWGVIVLFVMVSIWGILHLLQTTLFGNDRFSPTIGYSGAPLNQSQLSPLP